MLRLIPRNHKVMFSRYLVCVDTESNIAKEDINKYSEHSLKMGVAIYVTLDKQANVIKREVFKFYTEGEFWNWIVDHTLKSKTLIIYGHNLKYDSINLKVLSELQNLDYVIPYPILNNKFIMSCYKQGKQIGVDNLGNPRYKKDYKIKLVDTFNFLQFSLKEIGKRFGIEKLEADFENDTDEKLFKYCTRDTEIVEKFVMSYIQFLVNNNLGSFKDTLASTSYSVYRHAFLKEIWYHDDRNLLAFERASYYGGRTECFYIGKLTKQDYYVYDVKSMYPYIMKHKQLPNKPIEMIDNPPIELLQSYIKKGKYLIAECLIKTDDKLTPYPVRHENNKTDDFPYASTLLFPRGEFRTHLHLPEIQYALSNKHIKQVFKIAIYEQDYLFSEFIDYFYERKSKSTNKVERELSKLTMNSTYGAMAKRHYETTMMDVPDGIFNNDICSINLKIRDDDLGYAIQRNNNKRETYHAWLGKLYRTIADGLTPVVNGNVAIASAITAYARMYLFEMLKACGDNHRFYCDTDSIVTDTRGSDNLAKYVSENLGGLELQLQFNHGVINCPKDYEFGDKVRLKGVSRLSKKIAPNKYEMTRFTSFKDYIRTGKHGTIIIDKQLKRVYNKGVVRSNGFVLLPKVKLVNGGIERIE